jgi:hypothetical protein
MGTQFTDFNSTLPVHTAPDSESQLLEDIWNPIPMDKPCTYMYVHGTCNKGIFFWRKYHIFLELERRDALSVVPTYNWRNVSTDIAFCFARLAGL